VILEEQLSNRPARAKIRRLYVPNAHYFITAVTQARLPPFADEANVDLLRVTMRRAKEYHPFKMQAYAFMPDHLHLLILVPETTNISKLLQSIQRNFTRNYKGERGITEATHLWQRGFWDHVIRDDRDFENHFHYIHYNPVKHGYVTQPGLYSHTSFHEYVKRGWYEPGWGSSEPEEIAGMDFE
jgi:putative transposase